MKVETYTSQVKAQARVRSLIKQGYDPADIHTLTMPGGIYHIEY